MMAAVRLHQAIAFVPASQACAAAVIPGLCVRSVIGLSPSMLYVAWLAAATSPEIARFVRHAVDRGHEYIHPNPI
jgi:hypothetical protein